MALTLNFDKNQWSRKIIDILLLDRTTNNNIIWGTEDYEHLGNEYNSHFQIFVHLTKRDNSILIQPRTLKSKDNQDSRTKDKAEVFTPSWVCNEQNNLIDRAWFNRDGVFNVPKNKKWRVSENKIEFPNIKKRMWQDYIDERRLEVACGEAPYLVSRYDAVTGEPIEINQRIGLLDRKMRVVAENTNSEKEWLKWTERAFQSVYGFEFQGDNLLIARENLLMSYCEYMEFHLKRQPLEKELIKMAKIISWNLWQMDGMTYTIPYQKVKETDEQLEFFDKDQGEEDMKCIIRDWRSKKNITFKSLLN